MLIASLQEQARLQERLAKSDAGQAQLRQEPPAELDSPSGAALGSQRPAAGSASERPHSAVRATEIGPGARPLSALSPHGATDALLAAARTALQRERAMRQQARAP